MHKQTVKNVLFQATNPRRFPVMFKKLLKRIHDDRGSLSVQENLDWISSHCTDLDHLVRGRDQKLWDESVSFSQSLKRHSAEVLNSIEYDLGGGGIYPLLYFLVRHKKPDCVVETGVAAGFSSCAFLTALKRNGSGRLFSSDFPYFRLPNPESFIGVLVDESLKHLWELHLDGDEENLPRIIDRVDEIDVFHYDSDKSYSGRRFAFSLIVPRMSQDGIMLMDDIQDNSFFHDYVIENSISDWAILQFEGKYVGLIGKLSS